MLKPVRMQKIRIISLKSILEKLIEKLHTIGILEIRLVEHAGLEIGRPLEYFNDISEQLVKIRAIKNILGNFESDIPVPPDTVATNKSIDLPNPLQEAKKIVLDRELKNLTEEQNSIENELIKLAEQNKVMKKLNEFSDIDFSKLETKTVTYRIGAITGGNEKIKALKEKLDKTLNAYSLSYANLGNEIIAIIIYQRSYENIENSLSDFGFSTLSLPQFVSTPSKTANEITSAISAKHKKLESIRNEIAELSKNNYPHINAIERALSIEADRAEIASRFNFTGKTAIIEGWVKAEDFDGLQHELDGLMEKVMLEKADATHDEDPPVLLSNPSVASPLQFITQNYSLPNYYEIDPTIIYLFTIPLIYGMIVGDVIYGIISIFIAKFFMKKFSSSYIMSNVSRIWYYSAFPSMLFGLMFDEWAGLSHYHILEILEKWGVIDLASFGITGPFYQGISRVTQLPLVIGISAIVGLIHLGLGFILGAINEWHHNKKHAAAKIAWLGVEIGGALAVSALLLNLLPASVGNMSLGLLAVSVIALALTEGVMGILELPGLAGNVLSYARIAAIGVVGVILAEIINEFLIPLPQQGIFALIMFPLFVIMHAVNAFIAMFESLIQGGRLNIIEFKLKFLKGGGKPFEPFAVHIR